MAFPINDSRWNPPRIALIGLAVFLNPTIDAWNHLPIFRVKNDMKPNLSRRTSFPNLFHVEPHQKRSRNLSYMAMWMSIDDDDDDAETNGQYQAYHIHNDKAQIDSSTNRRGSSGWSVTDNWNGLSQIDNINYDYGSDADMSSGGTNSNLMVLNSIDQVTLAALRMQNFGMSSTTLKPFTEEEVWIQNSIQQIVSDSETDISKSTNEDTLDADQFLDDMGNDIAMLIRCTNDDKIGSTLFVDECEILDNHVSSSTTSMTTDQQGTSSYKRVELYNNTPIYMKDGEFVFIDEQSCIGCMQCASAAPGSFQMLEQGRARTYCQRNSPDVISAVASCPVDCMHYVSFDELKELEIARDVGVADDHRHFGHSSTRGYIAPTPLHVSRRDSDANHKSSFYHFIQDKCCKSTSCPQRGCYDCPKFDRGANPYFKEKLAKSTHIRAEYFKDTGIADVYRKIGDL